MAGALTHHLLWSFARVRARGHCKACLLLAANTTPVSLMLRRWSKKQKRKYPLDPSHADELPVFQYASAGPVTSNIVYTWGMAQCGALGNSEYQKPKTKGRKPLQCMKIPSRLTFGEKFKVTDVSCGYGYTVFAVNTKEKYKVFGTGFNAESQIGFHCPRGKINPLEVLLEPAPIEIPFSNPSQSQVLQVSCGRAHTLVLTDSGELFTLGSNAYGQCGRPIREDEEYFGNPTVNRLEDFTDVRIKKVLCGQDQSLFLTENGEVYSCGWGADGQTGQGHYNNQWKPGKVVGDVEGEHIVQLSCASDFVLAINDKGDVFGWGNSEYGQLKIATDEQQTHTAQHLKIRNVGSIVDVAAAGTMCMVLSDEGEVLVWGYGILGKGPQVDHTWEPSAIPRTLFGTNEFQPDVKVVSITSGISHLAAVTNNGDLYMWGKNKGGCLGLGHTKDQFFPLKVSLSASVKKVSCGVDHTAVICRPHV